MVRRYDAYKSKDDLCELLEDNLIIRNDANFGITNEAHGHLGGLIESITTEDASIYIHNPTNRLFQYLKENEGNQKIKLSIKNEEYRMLKDETEFYKCQLALNEHIKGQTHAIQEISKSLWYLIKVQRKKPYVIMLYGKSGLGKTEMVREIANSFFDGKFMEKHLSMFKNEAQASYFFGEKATDRSLGYDLLARQSNLVFFDELDKCPEYFYSAFYTLFDNEIFKDSIYDVDISNLIIFITSNYESEQEMRKKLGDPIYYRIDKFIHFKEFSHATINELLKKEIESRKSEFEKYLSMDEVYNAAIKIIKVKGENGRTIKLKVQKVIEDCLYDQLKE